MYSVTSILAVSNEETNLFVTLGCEMRHVTQWKRGFVLALVTATAWGLLPLALKITLDVLDPYTITWFRFLTAALVLGAFSR